jgi:hypothetical protein
MGSFKRQLPVKLTPEELNDLGGKLAEAEQKRSSVEADKAASMSEHNDALKSIRANITGLANMRVQGTAPRDVDCDEEHDFEHNEVRIVRKDAREFWPESCADGVVERRTMTAEERQPDLWDTASMPPGTEYTAAGEGDGEGSEDDPGDEDEDEDDEDTEADEDDDEKEDEVKAATPPAKASRSRSKKGKSDNTKHPSA